MLKRSIILSIIRTKSALTINDMVCGGQRYMLSRILIADGLHR